MISVVLNLLRVTLVQYVYVEFWFSNLLISGFILTMITTGVQVTY